MVDISTWPSRQIYAESRWTPMKIQGTAEKADYSCDLPSSLSYSYQPSNDGVRN
jgi:hypothetical protein